jgi:hypothetical protein
MPYTAEISRARPGCLIFLIDQSSSMDDPIGTAPGDRAAGEAPPRKADVVADSLNRLLFELSVRCAKEEGVRDYFHIAVIGYGHLVQPALSGALAGRDIVPLSEIVAHPARFDARLKKVSDGAGGLVERTIEFPVWVEPVASGGTPMCQALGHAAKLVQGWVDAHPDDRDGRHAADLARGVPRSRGPRIGSDGGGGASHLGGRRRGDGSGSLHGVGGGPGRNRPATGIVLWGR